MKKKVIKATHIDTGGHGYLSVSKKDFILAGGDPAKITEFSGHNFTRIFLEEDCDQSYFWDVATTNGFEIDRKSGYNLKFNIHHNYNPDLFSFVPESGDIITFHNNQRGTVINSNNNRKVGILVTTGNRQYGLIPASNPFTYIKRAKKLKQVIEEITSDIKKLARS